MFQLNYGQATLPADFVGPTFWNSMRLDIITTRRSHRTYQMVSRDIGTYLAGLGLSQDKDDASIDQWTAP